MRCPKCGSENAQFVTNVSSSGPSFMNGCCGFIFLGPIGLLCSFCGASESKEEYWICKECGKKFQSNDYERSLNEKEKQLSRLTNDLNTISNDINGLDVDEILNKTNLAKEEYELSKKSEDALKKDILNQFKILKPYKVISNILNAIGVGLGCIIFLISVLIIFTGGSLFMNIIIALLFFGICFFIVAIIMAIGDYIFDRKLKKVCPDEANKIINLEEETKIKKSNWVELNKIKEKIDKHKSISEEILNSQDDLDNFKKKE